MQQETILQIKVPFIQKMERSKDITRLASSQLSTLTYRGVPPSMVIPHKALVTPFLCDLTSNL